MSILTTQTEPASTTGQPSSTAATSENLAHERLWSLREG